MLMETRKLLNIVIQVFVVVISLSFLTELFLYSGSLPFFSPGGSGASQNITGTTTFNGTIRTYDPLLLLPVETPAQVVAALKLRSGVTSVTLEQDGYLVDTQTRDDVYPTAVYLRALNVSSLSIANIVIPQTIPVSTAAGLKNATTSEIAVVRVETEPLLDADSPVTVNMTAVVDGNGYLVDYGSAEISQQVVDNVFNATITGFEGKTYTYSIPWENRTSINASALSGQVDFQKSDMIVFTSTLTTAQVVAKKQFGYIQYIDTGSAIVSPDFANLSQVQANFQDVNYTLPASQLTVSMNSSDSPAPALPFSPLVSYSYNLTLQDAQGFDFSEAPILLVSDKPYAVNDSVSAEISAVAIGPKIILIRSVSIPS